MYVLSQQGSFNKNIIDEKDQIKHYPTPRFNQSNIAMNTFVNHLIYYPTPQNINYAWSYGSIAGLFFTIQVLTGTFLVMHYIPNTDMAFASVEHIMRDVSYGWLIRYLHANGASFIFIALYLHIAKALYYRSYSSPHTFLWITGVIVFLLMIITAFVGYVLPWGQMSFWGATVITSLITAIPYVGESLAYWIWGGFSVSNPTLNRFLSIHYLLPFIIIGLVLSHLTLLHEDGSNSPLGAATKKNIIFFWPYYGYKDLFAFCTISMMFIVVTFFYPNFLGHSDNYITANPLVTPAHIVPEWYFLPFYAILRAVPNKLGGVVAMLASILILIVLPFIRNRKSVFVKSSRFNPKRKIFFFLFSIVFILLGYIGGNVAEEPFITAGRILSTLYFLLLLSLEGGVLQVFLSQKKL